MEGTDKFFPRIVLQLHQNTFVFMQAYAQHVAYQIPNEHSGVGYMLDVIKNNDVKLQAALANIEDDTGPSGKHDDFEKAAAHMLPKDPVLKNGTLLQLDIYN